MKCATKLFSPPGNRISSKPPGRRQAGGWFLALWFIATTVSAQVPEWIWLRSPNGTASAGETAFFRKNFNVSANVTKIVLHSAADAEAVFFLNSKEIGASKGPRDLLELDLTPHVQRGANVIAAKCMGGSNTAGFIARLELTHGTVAAAANEPENIGQRRVTFIVTDSTWLAAAREPAGWQDAPLKPADWSKPATLGRLGMAPWGDVFAPPTATAAASLQTLPGFKVELLRSARIDEGSWVAMAFDPKGRLIIAPDPGGLLRLTLTPDGQVAETERLTAPINGAQGLLHAFDSFYVNNARGPEGEGLYRLRDTNGDDQFDQIELFQKFARSDHGPHALVLGPDQKIYVMNGNFSGLPANLAANSAHRNYQEDLLLPRLWDPNGHALGVLSPGGYVARTDRDGKNWELLLAGFRNPYDIAFNPDGEMFTYDADMEWDMGAPWYRPTRVNHCVSGGEYGWRAGSGKWPDHYPDSLPMTVNIGKGSPTGVIFGTGAKFPPRYQRAFYILDWAYGKIFAVHLQPEGATYTGTFETFLEGRPLNVTDVEIGRDGTMYFITGGWNTQSGLYRVTYTGRQVAEPARSQAESKAEQEAVQARALRRELEKFHGKQDAQAIAVAWPHLRSADRWIRYAARIAIEHQPLAGWRDRALAEQDVNASLTALLALARCGPRDDQSALLTALARFPFSQLSEAQQLDKLRVLSISFIRHGRPAPANVAPLLAELDAHYPARSEAMNRELCQVLIYLEAPRVVPRTLALIAAAPTPEEQMHYAFHLRNAQRGWTKDERRTYFAWFDQALTEFKGGNSLGKYLANMKRDAVNHLAPDLREELAAVIGELEIIVKVPPPSLDRKFVKDWKMDDLVPLLSQVSSGRSFQNGRKALIDAQCLACHQFGREGGSIGPDLTGVAGRFGRRELLEAILEPSKVIGFQYESTVILKQDGDDVTGKLIDEDDRKVVLITNPLEQTRVEISKSEIASRKLSPISSMPEGLANILTQEEILDLLALLEAGGRPNHTAFAK